VCSTVVAMIKAATVHSTCADVVAKCESPVARICAVNGVTRRQAKNVNTLRISTPPNHRTVAATMDTTVLDIIAVNII